jgi:hypothetical protein
MPPLEIGQQLARAPGRVLPAGVEQAQVLVSPAGV